MNPCPCGQGGKPGSCHCSDRGRLRYRRRLSGPLLDRFDLRVDVARPDVADLLGGLLIKYNLSCTCIYYIQRTDGMF